MSGSGNRRNSQSGETGQQASGVLKPEQAAAFLGVSIETLAQWRSQQRGPRYIKLENRLVRYRLAELEKYLVDHEVETTSLTTADA